MTVMGLGTNCPAFFNMSTILTMLERFKALDTDKIIDDTMIESEDMMADLNAEQINNGIKADGSFMPDYSFRSVFQYGKQPGPIRLRETGAYQAGIYAKVQGDNVVFESTDSKSDALHKRYGDNISGLSEKYRAEAMRESIEPKLHEKIERATGLKFN